MTSEKILEYTTVRGVRFLDLDRSNTKGVSEREINEVAFKTRYFIKNGRKYDMKYSHADDRYIADYWFSWKDSDEDDIIEGIMESVRNGVVMEKKPGLTICKDYATEKFLNRNLAEFVNEYMGECIGENTNISLYADIWDNYIEVRCKDRNEVCEKATKLEQAVIGAYARARVIGGCDMNGNYRAVIRVSSTLFDKIYMRKF
ncbi:MAG: hypothetical protein LUD47_07835 [Clostridia bacterium]|nr:hypothetical protein [Clostridia bacterium]